MGTFSRIARGIDVRVMVFIDGGYVRSFLDEYLGHHYVHYEKFGKFITNQVCSQERLSGNLIRTYYYDAIPDERDAEQVEDEFKSEILEKIRKKKEEVDEYLDRVDLYDGVEVRKGHLIISKKEKPRQKGVDTLVAIDMITKAYEGQFDLAILVGGDSDFIPLVNAVKSTGAKVCLAHFPVNHSAEYLRTFDRRIFVHQSTFEGNDLLDKKLLEKEQADKKAMSEKKTS